MSDVKIKVDIQTLENQIDIVNENVKGIWHTWKKMKSTMKGTKRYWKGDASDAHLKVLDLIDNDFNEILVLMSDHPNKLRKIAGIYTDAEDTAKETAELLPDDLF